MLVALRQKIRCKYGNLGTFAEIVGIKFPQLSKILHEKRKASPAIKERWAKILNVSKEELFKDA